MRTGGATAQTRVGFADLPPTKRGESDTLQARKYGALGLATKRRMTSAQALCRRDSPSRPQGAQEAQRHETLARRFQGPGLPEPTAPPLGLPLRPSLGHLLSQFAPRALALGTDLAPALGT